MLSKDGSSQAARRVNRLHRHLLTAQCTANQHQDVDSATTATICEALDEHGYCIVHGFLSKSEVAEIKADLQRILADSNLVGRNDFEGFNTRRIYALFAKTRCFDDLATHPLVLSVLENVLGSEHFLLSSPVGIEIAPGEKEQILHRDDGKYPLPRPFAEVIVNTMWAIDDFTLENGATVIIPGSHKSTVDERPRSKHRQGTVLGKREQGHSKKREEQSKEFAREFSGANANGNTGERAMQVQAVMQAGSMMFYRGSVMHGGGANRTDKSRIGVILEYVQGWLRPQENHCLAVPAEVAKELPPRLQELLGYSVHPPFIGYVDGRHPRRVLGD
jgi:ectoine hydroxylase-related dioxygenase (phytanoyl-CoA dioxygenase family)